MILFWGGDVPIWGDSPKHGGRVAARNAGMGVAEWADDDSGAVEQV
ncbi:MAG: hypothetical protein GY906_00270 [bacterium]|nr:hypothetical protein [bacterium]